MMYFSVLAVYLLRNGTTLIRLVAVDTALTNNVLTIYMWVHQIFESI